MNWLDLVIVVGLATVIFLGFELGLLRVAVLLGACLIGILMAGRYYEPLGQWLEAMFREGPARIVAFLFIFLATAAVVIWAAYLLKNVVSISFAEVVSRLGGASLGMAVGILLMGIVIILLFRFATMPVEIPKGLQRAQLVEVARAYRAESSPRQAMGNALEGSALSSFMIREIPSLPGFLPADFDPARELAFR
ncbi:MAG: CvpA family protein [Chloroflexi bacterium]|nr:CvpA family protein [Chloroflexota bacterium]